MKRNKKYLKDKKLRRTMTEYYKQRNGRYKKGEYSYFRNGWDVQYTLSKAIKKSPLGEYLHQILYLILDQKWTDSLEKVEPEWKHISKDEYNKLTAGQKMCFVSSSHLEAQLNAANSMYVPMSVSDYQIDPNLKEHIIPVVFKHFRKNPIYQHSRMDEKIDRDDLYAKSKKIMGEKHDDWYYYNEPAKKMRETIRIKQMKDEVREFQ